MLALCALPLCLLGAAPAAAAPRAEITRSAHGIPNIKAKNFEGLGYGYGYSFAQDNICIAADMYVTVRAQRSRFFGAGKDYEFEGNGAIVNNLNSDFFYQRIIDKQTVDELIARKPPQGPLPKVRDGVRGYVKGYNAYLDDVGRNGITDPACKGERWVRKIEPIDAYRRFYQLALLASQGVAINEIATAAPPTPSLLGSAAMSAAQRNAAAISGDERAMVSELADKLPLGGIGSNAYGLGKQATQNGSGMVLANPHFPWDGSERFYQSHLTIPGKLNVSGASLFGVPLVLIGHTERLAWSHTVSTAFRFTPFELTLVPGAPNTYLVDGQPRQMETDEVTVRIPRPGPGAQELNRTLYSTEYGPMINGILGLPLFPWTPVVGYAMGDVNAANFRYLNHFFETNQAQTTGKLTRILKRNVGIPWVNTIAADSRGRALYADIGAVPNVPTAKATSCSGVLGVVTRQALGLPVLDGARSECNWDTDPDSLQPGTFGPSKMPLLRRDDYVTNSNDSYWLSNPEQPLEGFARIIGDERTERSLRTRLGLRIIQQRLDGTDGRPGKGFTRGLLQDAVFNNRQYAGELWRDPLVRACRSNPTMLGSNGPVDVAEACTALAGWNVRDNVDSAGAVLFRRFASRALAAPGGLPLDPGLPGTSPFATPFSLGDPVNTPSGLKGSSLSVQRAFADAVSDLRRSGIPLDAELGEYSYELRGKQRIPIHGGPGGLGVFNAISNGYVPGKGFPDVEHGSSFVMVTSFSKNGACPDDRSILTYSQSANPRSEFFADQTRMYSKKRWNDPPFCAGEVEREAVDVTRLGPNGAR
ncbi:MAG: penicillin acylase family protein [Thermoleophilaceae bacterium]|nr:penicillin acylase family protein [Thermoleophilaceae bacterium]